MKHFVKGENRSQRTLLTKRLNDYIADTNLVRVVDVIDELGLGKLGFEGVYPAGLLKIYNYGYLNQVLFSRQIETGSRRNVELMWQSNR